MANPLTAEEIKEQRDFLRLERGCFFYYIDLVRIVATFDALAQKITDLEAKARVFDQIVALRTRIQELESILKQRNIYTAVELALGENRDSKSRIVELERAMDEARTLFEGLFEGDEDEPLYSPAARAWLAAHPAKDAE